MPSTGQLKLDQMRDYSRTPEGRASKKKSRDKQKLKRGVSTRTKKINHKPLNKAVANWKQI